MVARDGRNYDLCRHTFERRTNSGRDEESTFDRVRGELSTRVSGLPGRVRNGHIPNAAWDFNRLPIPCHLLPFVSKFSCIMAGTGGLDDPFQREVRGEALGYYVVSGGHRFRLVHDSLAVNRPFFGSILI